MIINRGGKIEVGTFEINHFYQFSSRNSNRFLPFYSIEQIANLVSAGRNHVKRMAIISWLASIMCGIEALVSCGCWLVYCLCLLNDLPLCLLSSSLFASVNNLSATFGNLHLSWMQWLPDHESSRTVSNSNCHFTDSSKRSPVWLQCVCAIILSKIVSTLCFDLNL